jgi:hypothetical protein
MRPEISIEQRRERRAIGSISPVPPGYDKLHDSR